MGFTHTENPLSHEELAQVIAADIAPGSYVNLGIGQPTTVSDYLDADQHVTLHTENGMLGFGPQAHGALAGAFSPDDADHAGAADALGDLDAPFAHLGGDQRRGAMLLQAEFGMGVDVAADRGQLPVVLREPGVEVSASHDLKSC